MSAPDHIRPRRSVIYVPASNAKALAKLADLSPDTVIFDLEDSVAPADKASAREALRGFFAASAPAPYERIIRINPLSGEWGTEDLLAAVACQPDAVLVPKVDTVRDLQEVDDALDEADADIAIWIMVETPRAILNLGALAEQGRDRATRLKCFVAGTNDLAKETDVTVTADRRYLAPYLAQIVVAARAGGLDVLDGPFNDFSNATVFGDQCTEAACMGFSGKTLIHPAQISDANRIFSPSAEAVAEAQDIRAAFALPENAGKNVIALGGRMVERLHLEQAERLLAKAAAGASQ